MVLLTRPGAVQEAEGVWKERLGEAGYELLSLPSLVRPALLEAALHDQFRFPDSPAHGFGPHLFPHRPALSQKHSRTCR